MSRRCPQCGRELSSFAVRCVCGFELPEARDLRSDPAHPHCAACGKALAIMAERGPSCGAVGYPARRGRRGKKSQGSPEST